MECLVMRRSPRLPKRFPVGTKYILESYGGFVRRYVEYPSGRRIELETRKALSCGCFDSSIVPELGADILNLEPAKIQSEVLSFILRIGLRVLPSASPLLPPRGPEAWRYTHSSSRSCEVRPPT